MLKRMLARFPGKCSRTGQPIRRGDEIIFCTETRQAWHDDEDEDTYRERTRTRDNYVSHVFNIGGSEYYRNKRGRCIDAPCCGCCTI